jgi:hypothetical protein
MQERYRGAPGRLWLENTTRRMTFENSLAADQSQLLETHHVADVQLDWQF